MKKILALVFATVFALSVVLSFSTEIKSQLRSVNAGNQYASIIPLPPPPPPEPRGC